MRQTFKPAVAGLVAAGVLLFSVTAQATSGPPPGDPALPPFDVGILGPGNPVTLFGLGTAADPVRFKVAIADAGHFVHTTHFSLHPDLPMFHLRSTFRDIPDFSVPIFENIGHALVHPGTPATGFDVLLPRPTAPNPTFPHRDFHHHPMGTAGVAGGFYKIEMWATPVPAAAWLFGSGVVGLVGLARRNNKMSAGA
jgi:hypothetical protein